MKKLVIGIILSILLIYLSISGIDFNAVMNGFSRMDYFYVCPTVFLIVVYQIIRSVRWGILLSPLEKVRQLTLFSVTSVGFLAIAAIPARLGELARPYLITRKTNIKMSSALGTIFIERIFDSLTVFTVFLIVLFMTPMPKWLVRSSVILIILTLAMMAFMLLLLFYREACLKVITPVIRLLPDRLAGMIIDLIHHFIDGFQILKDPKPLILVALLSALFWIVDIATIYLMFKAFNLQLPPVAACVLLVVLMIGIAIPAGPGFVGNWHYFCIFGLSFYGVPKVEALTFAIMYHFLSIGVIVILGLIFLPFNRFSLKDLRVNTK